MSNIDKLKDSQFFILQLAKGINPITGEIIEDNDIINNVAITREMFGISDLLKEVIVEEESKKPKRPKKVNFVYDEKLMSKAKISNYPISLSGITRNIKQAYDNNCRLTYKIVSALLYEEGILIDNSENKPKLRASNKAEEFGIWSEYVNTSRGEELRTFYNEQGQKFVFDLLKKDFSN